MNSRFTITNNKHLNYYPKYYEINKDIFLFYSKSPKKFKTKNLNLNIFGSIEGEYEKEFLKRKSINSIFGKIKNKNKLFECINNCEGRFAIIAKFKDEIYIILDKYSKLDIFFSQSKSNFYITDSFKIIHKKIDNLSFNNTALANQFLVHGARSAKKDTIFNEVRRIGVGQRLLIKKDRIKIINQHFTPKSENNYQDDMIDKYYEINKSFMLNFGDKNKALFMSSGFDSSYLLALQHKLFGSSKIIGLTCVQKFNKKSGVYNKFEIERVKKLAEFYNIKNYFIDVNLKDNFTKLSEETSEVSGNTMNTNHLSSMMFYKVSQLAKSKIETKTLMSGEISDGAHNLGFSQFLTTFDHENQGFREYSDKQYNYLYSPNFLEKVLKNNSTDDFVFNKLSKSKKIKFKKEFSSNNISLYNQIFDDLFNSQSRFPFEKKESKIVRANLLNKSKVYHKKNYFNEIKLSKFNQLYSSYLHLYNSFHWQASTISPLFNFSDKFNLNMTLPFWGHGVQKFLSEMPTGWGRGLEIKNIKYPLKESFRRNLKYPIFIEQGFHSYRYDERKFEDPMFEIINNIKTKNYITKILKKYYPCEYLDKKYFNINQINTVLKNYISGRKYEKDSNNIYSLYLFSKLLYDIDF